MKKLLSLILALVLIFSLSIIPAYADGTHFSKSTVEVHAGETIRGQFTVNSTAAYYKITATDNMYYKFTFTNQSVELKTGISIADDFLNLFLGKYSVEITDQYDTVLSNLTVRCGYIGNVSLKLTKGQTYYIKITTSADGYYKMQVDAFEDIAGNSWQTAAETESVGQLISSIDADGDKDWFYFTTDNTDSFYEFSIENISGSSTMKMYLYEYVEGAGQVPLRDTFNISASRSYTSEKLLKLKPNTKYYLCIYLNSGIGGYQLDITQTLDAVGDVQENSYNVNTDTKVTTALDASYDVDWFKFTTKNYDAYYYFNIENLGITNDLRLAVYDKDGNELDRQSVYTGSNLELDTKLEPNTEYYFKVYAAMSGFGNYSFTVTDIPDPFANEQENAGEIELNTTISESVGGMGDVDFYKFTTAEYDAYYYFNLDNLGISNDARLYIYDAKGNQIDYATGYTGSDLSVDTKLEPNTEYFFKIYAAYSGTGNYTVTVFPKADICPNELENAKEIELNQDFPESITGVGDVDFYKFTTADILAFYNIHMENLGISNDGRLYLYDANGNEIDYATGYTGNNLNLNIKLEPNTEYYFKLYATYSGTGNYKVKITYTEDMAGDVKQEAAEISLNESITQHLTSDDDIDWYKFTLPYDCNIRIVVVNESGNSKRFVLYSAIDKQLLSLDPYASSNKTVILDAGDYYVKVYDNDGYYTLSIGDCGSAHKEAVRYVKATTEADGIKTTYCKSCNTQIKKEVIPRIETVKLSSTSKVFDNKAFKPLVTVYDSNNKVIPTSQYTVIYPESCIDVGEYVVEIQFKDGYDGTVRLEYKITGAQLKKENGKWYYYYDGVKSDETTLVKYLGKWFYIKNGEWDTTITELVKYNGKWFYIKSGKWTTTTSLVDYKGKKFYINGGKWDSTAKGRKKIDGTYYLIKGGKWSKTTELYKEGSTYYYIKSGKWSKTTNVVKIGSTSYYIKSGKWSKTTTLYKKSGKYYAIKSGKWTKSKTIIKYNGKKYYVNNGYAQTKFSGKITIDGKKYTVKKGIVK